MPGKYNDVRDDIEPSAAVLATKSSHGLEYAAQVSIAVSLKRIADTLESTQNYDRIHDAIYNAMTNAQRR